MGVAQCPGGLGSAPTDVSKNRDKEKNIEENRLKSRLIILKIIEKNRLKRIDKTLGVSEHLLCLIAAATSSLPQGPQHPHSLGVLADFVLRGAC